MNHAMVFILLKTISRKMIYLNLDMLCVRYCALNTQSALQQPKPKIRQCFRLILDCNLIMAEQMFLGFVGPNIKSINKCGDN